MAIKSKRAQCSFCENESDGIHREVIGWEVVRGQGGANRILARKETGRVACGTCAADLRAGVQPGTPKLFTP